MNAKLNCSQASTDQKSVFKLVSENVYFIDSPCFLTVPDRTIIKYGIYLKSEGTHFDVIQILNVSFEDGYVYITIKDLKTKSIQLLSHIVGENYHCVWFLVSWEYFENDIIKRIKNPTKEDFFLESNC